MSFPFRTLCNIQGGCKPRFGVIPVPTAWNLTLPKQSDKKEKKLPDTLKEAVRELIQGVISSVTINLNLLKIH